MKLYNPKDVVASVQQNGQLSVEAATGSGGAEAAIGDTKRIAITSIISSLGVQPNVRGFFYLREAIIICTDTPEIVIPVTKVLYPTIANMFDTSPTRVERAIRHVIEVAWERGDLERAQLGSMSGFKRKPTNSEFIATIVDYIRLYNIINHST